MTKELPLLFSLAATLVLIWAAQAFPAEILTGQPLVVIDPGHDKETPGLKSETGAREHHLTLALARQISGLLSASCRVHLTRTSADQPLEKGRTEYANHEKADLLLSLHLHSRQVSQPVVYFFSLPEEKDADTWQTRATDNQDASRELAQTLAAAMKDRHPETRPLIFSGPALPLEGLNMPGILVELFAPSQAPTDPEKREAFLADQAQPIATALLTFLTRQ